MPFPITAVSLGLVGSSAKTAAELKIGATQTSFIVSHACLTKATFCHFWKN